MRRFCFIPLIFFVLGVKSQVLDSVIQFSGLTMSSDSLMAIPYVNIYSLQSKSGSTANYNGFFSFVANKGDSIKFTAIGYKDEIFVIPLNLSEDKYSVIQLMTQDTIFLAETIIYPWPSKEDFKNAFLSYNIPDDYYEIARKNLERDKLKEIGEQMAMDADKNADYQTKQMAQKIYYAGQFPPMRIFDVFAWKEFIEAWKRGDFKKDE